jgi:hypothetical protein
MAHWRKSYPPTSHSSFAGWMICASMLVGALVFIARHVHVWGSGLEVGRLITWLAEPRMESQAA